jgi:hypothetical protein
MAVTPVATAGRGIMTTQANSRTGVSAASSRRHAEGCLRSLWDVGEESFRTLINARFRRIPSAGVTDEERRSPMLGDALIPRPGRVFMRVADIDRDADAVWPWLAQMMRGGGIYGWPVLETAECRSADYLLEKLVPPRIGDRVGDVLEVAQVDAPREIVWRAPVTLELLGFRVQALTIDYLLKPRSSGSRLVVRTRSCCERLTSQICGFVCEVVEYMLPVFQTETIRRLAESYPERLALGRVNRDLVGRHQAIALEPRPAAAPGAVGG